MPGVSRSFHFWQPAPRLKNAFMAGTMVQPSHDPPTHKKTKGTCHSENIRKKHREEGREEELIERNLVAETTQLEGNSMYNSESLEGCSKLLGMYVCMLTYHGPIAHC